MPVDTRTITLKSRPELDIVDITGQISEELAKSRVRNGIVNIFVSGSTAAISTIEYEPRLLNDFGKAIERIVPSKANYEHSRIDVNAKSHIRSTLVGPSLVVPFRERKLLLGRWQQIVLMDFDVPARTRDIILQIMGD